MPAHPGQILLILIDLALEHQIAAATRARAGQTRPDLIDVIGHRRCARVPYPLAGLVSRRAGPRFASPLENSAACTSCAWSEAEPDSRNLDERSMSSLVRM